MQTKSVWNWLLLLGLLSQCIAANTSPLFNVAFMSIPFRGHINIQFVIAQELAKRGHNCTFIVEKRIESWVPVQSYHSGGRISVIPIDGWEGADQANYKVSQGGFGAIATYISMVSNQIRYTFNDTLNKIVEISPDVAVVDTFTPAAHLATKKLKLPMVVTSSASVSMYEDPLSVFPRSSYSTTKFEARVGNFIKFYLYPFFDVLGLYSELHNTIRDMGIPKDLEMYPFNLNELIIQATDFGLEESRMISPLQKFVGPILPNANYLPEIQEPLRDVLQGDVQEYRVIFDSLVKFGDLAVQPDSAPVSILWAFSKQQSKMLGDADPFRNVNDDMITVEANNTMITFVRFAPQIKVLSHPNVKLFVTHCGQNSISEALAQGKPAMGIPLFNDQIEVCSNLQRIKAGKIVDREFLATESASESIAGMIAELWKNNGFRENAEMVGNIMRDSEGASKAADWIEWRYKWREHSMEHFSLKENLKFSVWQRYYLDIWSIVLIFGATSAAVFYFATTRIVDYLLSSRLKQKAD
ncbi:UDP-glucuronosyltransferase 1-1 [Nowakowskiella sp. JEL0407]|nr:UDP-glucuronosyltransferase 1-1 [Nowakowskiella sp. JEL0407]